MDRGGRVVIKGAFKAWRGAAPRFRSGVAAVEDGNGREFFINREGHDVGARGFAAAERGAATLVRPYRAPSGLFGYRRSDGVILVPPFLERAGEFQDGRAPVSLGGRWWYIPQPR